MVVLRNVLWTIMAACVAMVFWYSGRPYVLAVLCILIIVAVQVLMESLLHTGRQTEAESRERELLAAATKLMNTLVVAACQNDRLLQNFKGDKCATYVDLPVWSKDVYDRRHESHAPLPDRVDLVMFAERFCQEVLHQTAEADNKQCRLRDVMCAATEELVAMASDLYGSRDQDITTTRLTARRVRFQMVEMLMRHAASVRMRPGQFAEILEKHGKSEALRDAIEKSKEELIFGNAEPWRDDLLKFVLFRKADGNVPKVATE